MTRSHVRRRAFIMLFALGASALAVSCIAVVLQLTALEIARERTALLASTADAVVASARAWSDANAARLEAIGPTTLPIDALLPGGVTGELTLTRAAADPMRVDCRIHLVRARESVNRAWTWPIASR